MNADVKLIESRLQKVETQIAIARAVILALGIGAGTFVYLWDKATDKAKALAERQDAIETRLDKVKSDIANLEYIHEAEKEAAGRIEKTGKDEVQRITNFVNSQDFLAKAREGLVRMNEDYFIRFADGPWDLNLEGRDMKQDTKVVIAGRTPDHRWRIEKFDPKDFPGYKASR